MSLMFLLGGLGSQGRDGKPLTQQWLGPDQHPSSAFLLIVLPPLRLYSLDEQASITPQPIEGTWPGPGNHHVPSLATVIGSEIEGDQGRVRY